MKRQSSCFASTGAAAFAACLLVILQFAHVAQAACGANSIEMTGAAVESCACESGYTGVNCGTDETATASALCGGWDVLATDPVSFTVVPGIANAGSLISNAYVQWTVSIPVGKKRQITNIRIGDSCSLGASMHSMSTTLNTLCEDVLVINVPVTDLSGCGFTLSPSDSTHTLYSGDLSFDFTQNSAAGFSNFVGEIVVPVNANIETSYTENQELGETLVFSSFDMTAAIKLLNIDSSNTTTYLSLEYIIAYPYTVKYIGGALTETGGQIAEICTADSGVTPCGTTAFPMTTCNVTGDYSTNSLCTQTAYIKIDHNSQCVLDGDYVLNNIVIGCFDGATDCPLEEDDTNSSITLTLASKNFCAASDVTNIEDVVNLDRFIFVYPDNRERNAASFTYNDGGGAVNDTLTRPEGNDNRQSLLYGDYIYGRLDFSGALVTNVTVKLAEVSVDNGLTYNDVLVPLDVATAALIGDVDYVTPRADPVAYEAALNCSGMGYCAADQSLYFRTILNSTYLATGVSLPAVGNAYEIDLRVTVQISLETNGTITTRRRSFGMNVNMKNMNMNPDSDSDLLNSVATVQQARKREVLESSTVAINKAMVMTKQDFETATDVQKLSFPTLTILIPENFAEKLQDMPLEELHQVEDAIFSSLQLDEATKLFVVMYRIVIESDWVLDNRRSVRAVGDGPPVFEIIFGNGENSEDQGKIFASIAQINSKIETGAGIKVKVNGQEFYLNDSKFEVKDVIVPIEKVQEFEEGRNANDNVKDDDSKDNNDSAAAMVTCTATCTFTSLIALSVLLF